MSSQPQPSNIHSDLEECGLIPLDEKVIKRTNFHFHHNKIDLKENIFNIISDQFYEFNFKIVKKNFKIHRILIHKKELKDQNCQSALVTITYVLKHQIPKQYKIDVISNVPKLHLIFFFFFY